MPTNPLQVSSYVTGLYAKGVASASLGLLLDAEKYQKNFEEYLKIPELQGHSQRAIHLIAVYDNEGNNGMMNIGREILAGEILYRKGNFKEAFQHLRLAVEYDDGLKYDDPWGWMVPARHALGALLLEQNEVLLFSHSFSFVPYFCFSKLVVFFKIISFETFIQIY